MAPTAQTDAITHALRTLQSLHETYLAPTLPAPLPSLISTLLSSTLTITPWLSTLYNQFSYFLDNLAHSSSDNARGMAMISTGLFILTAYIGLRIMNYVRRTIFGWVWLGIKIVVLLVLVQIALYVNSYGVEAAIKSASWWGGIVWGFVEEVLDGRTVEQRNSGPRGTRGRSAGKVAGGRAGGAGRTRWN